MQMLVRYRETPNGAVVIKDVEPSLLADETAARRMRRWLSGELGGTPVLLRCRIGKAVYVDGPASLQRYASDPLVEALPLVSIELDPWQQKAA